jgi:hypothetical protein
MTTQTMHATQMPTTTATEATSATVATKRPMESMRKTALAAGVLYLITIAASIPALALKEPFLKHTNFIVGAGRDTGVIWAGVLDLVTALACIGTAVVLYRVAKKQSETAALGFVAARVLEAGVIFVGVISIFAAVTLRHDFVDAGGTQWWNPSSWSNASSLGGTGRLLVAIHNWTFLVGPGLIPGINALFLGYVMYRSRLVPRVIPLLGLIGAPLILASGVAVMFRAYDQVSTISAIATVPIALWELSLGLWLVIKGFQPTAVANLMPSEG